MGDYFLATSDYQPPEDPFWANGANTPTGNDSAPHSPLRERPGVFPGYQHLLPETCQSVSPLDRHLFMANIATVFPTSRGKEMTLSLGRATDRALNPITGHIEPRTLVYAAVLVLDGQLNDEDDLIHSQRLLVKGPAMPYFAPASREVRSLFELEDYELAKGCAIALLVYKVEKLAHKQISQYDDDIEVWGGAPHVKDGIGESAWLGNKSFPPEEVVSQNRGAVWRHSYC